MKRLFALLLALVLLTGSAFADEGVITVSGTARVSIDADCVSAVLGVNLSGTNLTSLQAQANETMDAICAALVNAGLDAKNISTNYINISPDYYSSSMYRSDEQELGYVIDNSLSIQTDEIDKLGTFIDAAFAAGANTLNSINFSAKDDSAARKQAMESAVKNAAEKAEIIAAASGRSLGDIVEIHESGVYSYALTSYDGWNAAKSESSAAGTSVRGAQISVSADIQITYELK